MPPQPLSKVKSRASLRWGPGTATRYPDLCCLVMETIGLGAQVEFNWSAILVDMLRADFTIGIAMYEALSGSESRRAALLGAAESALSADDFLLLKAIDKVLAPARRSRNDFVHHIWGISDEVPNALALIDPKCLRKFEVGVAVVNLQMSASRKVLLPPDIDRSLVAIWKEAAIREARDSAIDALSVLGILSTGLSSSQPAIEIGDSARQQLLSRPAVAQALQRMSPQKTPPILRKPRGKTPSSKR